MARWRGVKVLRAMDAYQKADAEGRAALEASENTNLMRKRLATSCLILVLLTDLVLLILDRHSLDQSADSVAQRLGYTEHHAADGPNPTFETLPEGAEDPQPRSDGMFGCRRRDFERT
jgi:hypothetical protein